MKRDTFQGFKENAAEWIVFWILIAILVIGLIMGLTESIPGLETSFLLSIGAVAMALGWQTARVKRHQGLILLTGSSLGLLLLSVTLSGAVPSLWQGFWKALRLFQLGLPSSTFPPVTGQVLTFVYAALTDWIDFWGDVSRWAANLASLSGQFNRDAILFFWGQIFWSALFLSGWCFRRKVHGFYAGLPALSLLAGVLGYTRQNTLGLVLALGAWLGLMALSGHLKREQRWRNNKIDFSEEIRFDLALLGLPVILVILLISGVIPNFSIKDLRDFFENTFGTQRKSTTDISDPLGLEQAQGEGSSSSPGSMPRSFLIDAGPDLTDTVIMVISSPSHGEEPDSPNDEDWADSYWFGSAYDIYNGQGWEIGELDTNRVAAGMPITTPDTNFYELITAKITKTGQAGSTLFTPGQPETVDQSVTVKWRTETGDFVSGQLQTSAYTISAYKFIVVESEIQKANAQAPEAIRQTYLSLPDTLPDRVYELAASLTDTINTSYDQATAIETFLRSYEYTLDIPAPPRDQDVVDYFLFDLKKGYCDYYASAMVVLSRAAGLPARLIVGYAGGVPDEGQQDLIITKAQAHSWAEVYIAPFGWIPFEPTASLPQIPWEENRLPGDVLPSPPPLVPSGKGENAFLPDLPVLVPMLVTFIITASGIWLIFHLSQKKAKPQSQTVKIFRQYTRLFSRLFLNHELTDTPLEYQNKILIHIQTIKEHKPTILNLILKFKENLKSFTSMYNQNFYAQGPTTPEKVSEIRTNWRVLKRQALLVRLIFFFSRT